MRLAASAFATTHFAAAAGGLAWAAYEWLTRGKPSVLGAASGVVAGLVCITPGAGFVNVMPAIHHGRSRPASSVPFACSKIKATFGYDDSLDAFGVHGVGGTLGRGPHRRLCHARRLGHRRRRKARALLEGGSVLTGQVVAVVITWVFSIVATFIILNARRRNRLACGSARKTNASAST